MAQPLTYHSSITVEVVVPQRPAQQKVAVEEGQYKLVNAYSGKFLETYRTLAGALLRQADQDVTASQTWTVMKTDSGAYLLTSADGVLTSAGDEHRTMLAAQNGPLKEGQSNEWDFVVGDGSTTLRIQNKKNELFLENTNWATYSGSWVTQADEAGGLNQEWELLPATAILVDRPVRPTMIVRGPAGSGEMCEIPGLTVDSLNVESTYQRQGLEYEYTFRTTALEAIQSFSVAHQRALGKMRLTGQPEGWVPTVLNWNTQGFPMKADLKVTSTLLPGPVLAHARGVGNDMLPPHPYFQQHTSFLLNALTNRGSQAWTIGPAIDSENLTESSLREQVEEWVAKGLGFLYPLLQNKGLRESMADLNPTTPFEKSVVDCLKSVLRLL